MSQEGDAKVEEAKHHYDEVQKNGNSAEDEEVLKDFEKYYDVAPAASGSAEGH